MDTLVMKMLKDETKTNIIRVCESQIFKLFLFYFTAYIIMTQTIKFMALTFAQSVGFWLFALICASCGWFLNILVMLYLNPNLDITDIGDIKPLNQNEFLSNPEYKVRGKHE